MVHLLLLVHLLLAVHGGRAVALRGVALLHPPRLCLVMCPGPRLPGCDRVRASRGSVRLAVRAVSCVAFEDLEARGKAREPRSAGQRRRVVRYGLSAGRAGQTICTRPPAGVFSRLAIFVSF